MRRFFTSGTFVVCLLGVVGAAWWQQSEGPVLGRCTAERIVSRLSCGQPPTSATAAGAGSRIESDSRHTVQWNHPARDQLHRRLG